MGSRRNMVSRDCGDSLEADRAEARPIAAGDGGGGLRAMLRAGLNFRWAKLGGGGTFFLGVSVVPRLWAFAVEAKAPATTAAATRSFRACMISHHPGNSGSRHPGQAVLPAADARRKGLSHPRSMLAPAPIIGHDAGIFKSLDEISEPARDAR
jgi:hypothetical protein